MIPKIGYSSETELAIQVVRGYLRVPVGGGEGLLGLEIAARSVGERDLEGQASTTFALRDLCNLR